MAIIESAVWGKPTIAPDHGGFTEIIGRDESAIGRLFTPGNVDELEGHIMALWNNPDLVQHLGHASYDKLKEQYCSEVIYRRWERLFGELLARK